MPLRIGQRGPQGGPDPLPGGIAARNLGQHVGDVLHPQRVEMVMPKMRD
ncbi:MAG TPA: hypothetical protein VFO16_06805 [Pseudonocardiaceae bacterium]|nr:hypothetical protein [Pseudonocardiaceae bacterium]